MEGWTQSNGTAHFIQWTIYMRRNFTTLHSIEAVMMSAYFCDDSMFWFKDLLASDKIQSRRFNLNSILLHGIFYKQRVNWMKRLNRILPAYRKIFRLCVSFIKSHIRCEWRICWLNEFQTKKPDRNRTAHLSLNYY